MGLFGSNTKTYYNSVSTPLFEKVPSLMKQTVVASITQNRNISEDLITNLSNGILYNANRLYTYGKSGNFDWGLPEGTFTHIVPQMSDYVERSIVSELGVPIELSTSALETDTTTGDVIYNAEYYLLDSDGKATGNAVLWTYATSTGTHPLLDVDIDDTHAVSPYYPIIPVYKDQVYLAKDPVSGTNPARQPITQALRYLLLKPDDLSEAIEADPDYPDNPIEDAVVMLAVEAADETQEGKEYMYRYFELMYGISKIKKDDFTYWQGHREGRTTPPINRMVLKDDNYKMELGWLYIDSNIVTGNLLKPDGVSKTHDYFTTEYVAGGEHSLAQSAFTLTYSLDTLIIRKQINATQYRELSVVGLVHSNYNVDKEVRTTLKQAFDPDDSLSHAFIIPLRKDLLYALGPVKSHDLMYTSIRMILNDKFVYKLKWYETDLFKFILLVIVIVISVYYPPAGMAVGTIASLGYAIVNIIVMKLLVPIAMRKLQDIVGEELALVIAVAATIWAGGGDIASLINATSLAISEITRMSFENSMENIAKELEGLEEDMDLLEEKAAKREADVLLASRSVSGDSYAIMTPLNHVRRFHLETKEPTLIRTSTQSFTDIARFVDRPESYINLGHSGA